MSTVEKLVVIGAVASSALAYRSSRKFLRCGYLVDPPRWRFRLSNCKTKQLYVAIAADVSRHSFNVVNFDGRLLPAHFARYFGPAS